jgi:hypothetical protein
MRLQMLIFMRTTPPVGQVRLDQVGLTEFALRDRRFVRMFYHRASTSRHALALPPDFALGLVQFDFLALRSQAVDVSIRHRPRSRSAVWTRE